MASASNEELTTRASQQLIQSCLARGIDHFFVAPGSRSTPLALAVAAQAEATTIQHFDERGLAFAATGYGRATGKPSAFICTSGTAVANALPAVVEASQDAVPLLLLTADRPPELRQIGSNQTIDQVGIFGGYVRHFVDLPCPSAALPPRYLDAVVAQAVTETATGPVHLNCMYREPFGVPTPPAAVVEVGRSESEPEWRCALELAGGDTLVVVGQCPGAERDAAAELARRLNCPLLVDIAAGLPTNWFDLQLLRHDNPTPETVIHVGGRLVSKRWLGFLEQQAPRNVIHLPGRHGWIDPALRVTSRVAGPIVPLCRGISLRQSTSPSFTERWRANSDRVRSIVKKRLTETQELTEPAVAHVVATSLPDGSGLFLGNSMPVRDMLMFGVRDDGAANLRVGTNRGASGIDGLVASAAGFAVGLQQPTTLVLGDLSLLHDLNSLALLRQPQVPPMDIVVINNNGGGIFHFLPVAELAPNFESVFGTPHGLSFRSAAEMFGVRYENPQTLPELRGLLGRRESSLEHRLIEIQTDRYDNVVWHRELEAQIRGDAS